MSGTQYLKAVVATLVVAAATSDRACAEEELGQRVEAYLERLEPLGFAGGAVVMIGDEVAFKRAFGLAQRAANVPMRSDTALPLGSISKQFTAVAIMRLVAAGELELKTTLGEVFDSVPEEKRAINVHQLLTHTSGIAGYAGFGRPVTTADELVKAVMSTELMFPPGAESEYSNLGYGLLAAIVERISEQPFEEFLRTQVFEPAGMKSTGIRTPRRAPEAIAHGYIDGNDEGPLGASWTGAPWSLLGAGGIQSTLDDMVQWELALRDELILDRATVELMATAHVSGGGYGTGYGYGVFPTPRGTTMVGHDGSNDVFGADWRRYPDEDVMIFVASNDADLYAMDVAPQLEQLIFGEDVPLPPRIVDLGSDVLSRYAGEYQSEAGDVVTIEVNRGALFLASPSSAAAGLLNPVLSYQVGRRAELLQQLPVAFQAAARGEYADLHRLLDPFAPLEEFAYSQAELMASFSEELGELDEVRAVPGRNRFGEIAVVVVFDLERGERLIEFSFGEAEVGSIRFLESLPRRVARASRRRSSSPRRRAPSTHRSCRALRRSRAHLPLVVRPAEARPPGVEGRQRLVETRPGRGDEDPVEDAPAADHRDGLDADAAWALAGLDHLGPARIAPQRHRVCREQIVLGDPDQQAACEQRGPRLGPLAARRQAHRAPVRAPVCEIGVVEGDELPGDRGSQAGRVDLVFKPGMAQPPLACRPQPARRAADEEDRHDARGRHPDPGDRAQARRSERGVRPKHVSR